MRKSNSAQGQGAALLYALVCCALAALWLLYTAEQYKTMTLLVSLAMAAVLLTGNLYPLRRVPVALLCAYVLYSGLSGFWAVSGKFYLREYAKILVGCAVLLAIVLKKDFDARWTRRVMALIAGTGALFSLMSVEAAATGLTRMILQSNSAMASITMGFSDRLYGVFGNANIMATILGVGVFASLGLLCGAEDRAGKRFSAVLLALNAFTLLLGFSMGGMFCFAAAVVIYLVFAGRQRGAVLVRMLEGAIPTLLWGFVASAFFNRGGLWNLVPLAALALNCATVVLLEEKVAPRLIGVLEQRQRLVLVVLAGLVVLSAAYVAASYNLSGPYTFQEETLRRSAYPQAGVHSLSVEADGDVSVTIVSQNMSQVMMHTDTVIYQGAADGAQFTVPEDSQVCYFTFYAQPEITISQALLDGQEAIRLDYTLLPDFVADRIQGLWANQNAIQRTVFFQDGMKLFYQHPILGSGVGAFETALTSVQDFYYATRYIHNHYIQILVENGLPGLLFFAGGLLSLAVLLWRRRKEWEDVPSAWAYPALWAALVMLAAHSAVEVSMSNIVVVCYAYGIFGLIVTLCPEKAPATAGAAPAKKKRGQARRQSSREKAVRGVLAALPAFFAVTLGLNMAALAIATSPVANFQQALDHYVTAAAIDPYEKNDAKLSYIMSVLDDMTPERREQADQYAAELLQVQSNSIPYTLAYYYLGTGQYFMAVQAAQKAAVYSASDATTWNNMIGLFNTQFTSADPQAIQGEEGKELRQELLEYYDALRQYNQNSMESIQLSPDSITFFNKLLNLDESPDDAGQIDRLLYRSWMSCDSNADGVPDQITTLSSAAVGENGAVSLEAGGSVSISINPKNILVIQMTVTCQDPAALTMYDQQSGQWVGPDTAENGQAVFYAVVYQQNAEESGAYSIPIASSVSQTLSQIEILNGVDEG